MPDPFSILATLRRPQLLIGAAHLGLPDYRRDRSLPRLLPDTPQPSNTETFKALIDREAVLDHDRRAGDVTYSPTRHVALLTALIAEARLMRRQEV